MLSRWPTWSELRKNKRGMGKLVQHLKCCMNPSQWREPQTSPWRFSLGLRKTSFTEFHAIRLIRLMINEKVLFDGRPKWFAICSCAWNLFATKNCINCVSMRFSTLLRLRRPLTNFLARCTVDCFSLSALCVNMNTSLCHHKPYKKFDTHSRGLDERMGGHAKWNCCPVYQLPREPHILKISIFIVASCFLYFFKHLHEITKRENSITENRSII